MEKTEKEIEKDVYRIIKASALKSVVKGQFYRAGMRPKSAETEDVVVRFHTGLDGQEQSGIVLVHVYVPNIKISADGELAEDITRIEHLESIINEIFDSLEDDEYWFEKDGTPKSYPAEGVEQHFINTRIKYRRKSF